MEELGIGRPSTYAAILQTLRDREYVRMEKNRFFAEESGRLLTAFLERFFDRYVAYDFTAGMEDELDIVSDGKEDWKKLLRQFWTDFKPKTDEVMERKPSEVTEALDEYLGEYLFPQRADGHDPRRVAWSLATTRATLEHRAVVLGAQAADFARGLDALERAGVRTAFMDAMDAVVGDGR